MLAPLCAAELGSIAILALSASRVAQAAVSPLDLEWSAPAECPGADAVRTAVSRDLGDAQPGAPLVVRGKVERSGAEWVAHLAVAGPEGGGERTLRAASCAELTDAAALILALAIDPHAAAPPPASTAAAPASLPSPAASSSGPRGRTGAPRSTLDSGASSVRRDGLGVAILGAGDLGILPALTAGASGEVFFSHRGFRVDVDATWLAGARADAARAGAGGDFTFLAAGARAEYTMDLGSRVDLGPSLGAELERVHAQGFGVSSPSADTATWVALRAGGVAAIWMARGLSAALRLEAEAPLSRPAFVLDGVGSVHRPAFLGARAGLGLELVLF